MDALSLTTRTRDDLRSMQAAAEDVLNSHTPPTPDERQRAGSLIREVRAELQRRRSEYLALVERWRAGERSSELAAALDRGQR